MANKRKEGESPRDWMPWAGIFLDRDLFPKAFESLPEWRKSEMLGIAEPAVTIPNNFLDVAPEIPTIDVGF